MYWSECLRFVNFWECKLKLNTKTQNQIKQSTMDETQHGQEWGFWPGARFITAARDLAGHGEKGEDRVSSDKNTTVIENRPSTLQITEISQASQLRARVISYRHASGQNPNGWSDQNNLIWCGLSAGWRAGLHSVRQFQESRLGGLKQQAVDIPQWPLLSPARSRLKARGYRSSQVWQEAPGLRGGGQEGVPVL